MRLLATDLGPGKVATENGLGSDREVRKNSGDLGVIAVIPTRHNVRGASLFEIFRTRYQAKAFRPRPFG
jgi:hypothetical protein